MTFAARRDRAIQAAIDAKRIVSAAWWRFAIQNDADIARFEADFGKPKAPARPHWHDVRGVPSTAHTPTEQPTRQLPADCVELFAQSLHATSAAPDDDGKLPLPKWVHLTPQGDEGHELALQGERVVRGRDGREFAIGDVQRVIAGTDLPMQFDWDHESVSWFGSTKAAGWVDKIEYLEEGDEERPDPGFWGRVERWTPEGKSDVQESRYRGLSPVVRYEYRQPAASDQPSPPPLLVGFVNVALTNRPNLKMALLNSEGQPASEAKDTNMNGATSEQLTHAANVELADAFEAEPLTAAEQHVARSMGLTEEEFRAAKLDDAAASAAYHGTGDAAALRMAADKACATAFAPAAPRVASVELTEEERRVAHRMGLTVAEYAAAKEEGL